MSGNESRNDIKYVAPHRRRAAAPFGSSSSCTTQSNSSTRRPGRPIGARQTQGPGDPYRSFPIQFGSTSHGFMNAMQISDRTNLSPQKLDEWKHDQARRDSLRGTASKPPTSTISKLRWRKKDARVVDQSNPIQLHSILKGKKDLLIPVSPSGVRIICNDLPQGLEITSGTAEDLRAPNYVSLELYPRLDLSTGSVGEHDKWSKLPGLLTQGQDMHHDIGHGGNLQGLRPGLRRNFGVSNYQQEQPPVQYAKGIVSGSVQSPGFQGGMGCYTISSNRQQHTPSFRKYTTPSPQNPLQVMHKPERKYEVQAKHRQWKGILDKLTPQNFGKLHIQFVRVIMNIDNADTLSVLTAQIYEKAVMKPTFSEMYAKLCYDLAGNLPDFSEDNQRITFKRVLLNVCQEEFERGGKEPEEANRAEEHEVKETEVERERIKVHARERKLGNVQFIGELCKVKIITELIIHRCIKELLGKWDQPAGEEDVEALCKLMIIVGEMIDRPRLKEHIDTYFEKMSKLSDDMKLSSRVRVLLKDALDLRKNNWQCRWKVPELKKIEEVHIVAAQEMQTQSSRLAFD